MRENPLIGKSRLLMSQLDRQIKRLEYDNKKEELAHLNQMLDEAHLQLKKTLEKANDYTGRKNCY